MYIRAPAGVGALLATLSLLSPTVQAAPDLVRDMTPLDSFAKNVAEGATFAPGELLLTARSVDHLPTILRALDQKQCKRVRQLGRRPMLLVQCPPRADMKALIAVAQDVPGVRWVEASYYEQEEAAPNDLDARQWYHDNTGQSVDGQAGLQGADIGSLKAWDITPGDQRRIILINDVGVYTQHVDLKDQIWVNEDEDCTNGIDDDQNGYVDDCHGYDFGDDDNDPDPSSLPEFKEDGSDCLRWHATMIAGLAAARGNNDAGIVGVNWNVSIMNVKKHRDSSCVATTSRSIEAVLYAADNGADVVSMSFSSSTYNATFEAALQEAERKNVVAVSSGGNGGRDNDNLTRYPNEYDVQASIIVGNSDNLDRLDPGANFGAQSIDLGAPGTVVMSTSIDGPNAYSFGTGSSYSAAFAAGAVTLTRSAFPMLTNLEVVQAVKDGAERVPGLDCAMTPRCVRLGARIDTWGALQKAAELAPAELSLTGLEVQEQGDGDGIIEAGESALLKVRADNSGRGGAFFVQAALTGIDGGTLNLDRADSALGDIPSGQSNDLQAIGEPLVVSVPSDCNQSFTATMQVSLTDRFERTWTGSAPLQVQCDAVDGPDGGSNNNNPGNEGELDAEGCQSLGGSGSFGLLAALGLGLLFRRRTA